MLVNSDEDEALVHLAGGLAEVAILEKVDDPLEDKKSPISHNVNLTFRTREDDAMLLFAYDNCHNILQIHLSHGNEITAIWNDGMKLIDLRVTTDTGKLGIFDILW